MLKTTGSSVPCPVCGGKAAEVLSKNPDREPPISQPYEFVDSFPHFCCDCGARFDFVVRADSDGVGAETYACPGEDD